MKVRGWAIAVAVVLLAGCSQSEAPTPAASAAGSSEPGAAATADGHETNEHDHAEESDPPPVPTWDEAAGEDAVARAEGFVRAWARPDLDATTWFSGLQGFLSPSAAEGFLWTDPAVVPATTVTGAASLVDGSATSATVVVPTDAGDHLVVLVHVDDQTPWQVASLSPMSSEVQP